MSMHIEFKDDYNETTYYFGTVKKPESTSHGEYDFTVVVAYFSTQGNWTITEIIWDKEPSDKDKAEKRISDMVMEWHGKRCDIDMVITARDPGDEDTGDEHEAKEHMGRKSIISSIGYRGEE